MEGVRERRGYTDGRRSACKSTLVETYVPCFFLHTLSRDGLLSLLSSLGLPSIASLLFHGGTYS